MTKQITSLVLLACLSVQTAPAQSNSADLKSTETLKQISLNMAQAMKSRDADELSLRLESPAQIPNPQVAKQQNVLGQSKNIKDCECSSR